MDVKNEYFDSAECPFEVLGFLEEFSDAVTRKNLGKRWLEAPTRPPGSPGLISYQLTEPLHLIQGIDKAVVIKPGRQVISIIQIICGRMKKQ